MPAGGRLGGAHKVLAGSLVQGRAEALPVRDEPVPGTTSRPRSRRALRTLSGGFGEFDHSHLAN